MPVSGRSVEAAPGLVGQVGDPLGPQHRRELAKHAWETLRRYHRHTIHEHLAPGHLGAVNGHDRPHHDVGVGQDLGGSVGLEVDGPHGRGEGVAAMPQPPRRVELEAASIQGQLWQALLWAKRTAWTCCPPTTICWPLISCSAISAD